MLINEVVVGAPDADVDDVVLGAGVLVIMDCVVLDAGVLVLMDCELSVVRF